MFIGFANFYQRFIQNFSRIAILLTFLLKTTKSFKQSTLKTLEVNNNKIVSDGDDRANTIVMNLSKSKKFRNSICISNIKAIKEPNLLISNTNVIGSTQ